MLSAACIVPKLWSDSAYSAWRWATRINDHQALRHDIALQTAVDTDGVLASQSTLCRFEQQADRDWAITIHEEMIEQFIRSFRRPPKKPLYLDFDATADRVHGQQLGRHFNGYYNHYIFLPLFVSVATSCWSAICVRPRWMPLTTPAPSSPCWSGGCARRGLR